GVGVLGLGVWAATGLAAIDRKAALDRICPDPSQCVVQGEPRAREGAALATASTVGLVVGRAALGAGATVQLRPRRASRAAPRPAARSAAPVSVVRWRGPPSSVARARPLAARVSVGPAGGGFAGRGPF